MDAPIYLGTSAFTAAGWDTAFYPAGMKSADYLSYYATKFQAVEIDSTFYATPAAATVTRWRNKTPEGFIIAAKVPQIITHEKCLLECDEEFAEFIEVISLLGDRLGPLLLQFPYFNSEVFQSGVQFLSRLKAFFKKLPKDKKFAIEIRNKWWIKPQFLDVLREHNVAFVLQDQSWMPRPGELFEKYDPVTANFAYIRWLGDRKGIETLTKVWDKTVIDRSSEMQEWVKYCRQIQRRGVTIYAFANNHYAGHGPGTVALFKQLYGLPDSERAPLPPRQTDLFAAQKEENAE
ncbi:MAG TPA: DUF72 domain-containing protein [Candidatus Sulfotelmatobacter sp.]|nr:DUF72 domain-containing protein [Candidatus Sulfotelmatobacter sp.]